MVDEIAASGLVRTMHAPAASARALEAVADDAHRPDAQIGVVASDSNRDDPAGMEHTRQSRLSRWQRLPT